MIALPLFPDIESVGVIRSDQIVAGPGFEELRTLRLDLGGAPTGTLRDPALWSRTP